MLMIDPPCPAATRCLPNTWQPKNTPLRLTRTMRSNSSSVMSKNGVAELMPAPLTTMSTRPERCSTASSSASISALLVASAAWNHAGRRPLRSLRYAPRPFPALRPTITTSAPALARPSAIAPHSSPVPPMTTATLPRERRVSSGIQRGSDTRPYHTFIEEAGSARRPYIPAARGEAGQNRISSTESPNSCCAVSMGVQLRVGRPSVASSTKARSSS